MRLTWRQSRATSVDDNALMEEEVATLREEQQEEQQEKLIEVEQLKQEVSVIPEKLKKLKTNSRGRRVNCRR